MTTTSLSQLTSKSTGDSCIFQEKLCVPTQFQGRVIREHHTVTGHLISDRLWSEMSHRYEFGNPSLARRFANNVGKTCTTCQACQRPPITKAFLQPTLIPQKIMTNVAIDLFRMPSEMYKGETFETLALCLDRHSGLVLGTPIWTRDSQLGG